MLHSSLLWLQGALVLVALSSLKGTQVQAQAQGQAFFPPSIPLAIRSPYLNVWHVSGNGTASLSPSWPYLWTQAQGLGWAGKIRIDGNTYSWMSQDEFSTSFATVTVTNVQITPTRSIFTMRAGPMNLTVTFLSPIEPSDWVKQSFPFSFVYVAASSLDGASHSVQLYSDITAEWLSGNRGNASVRWNNQNAGKIVYHEIELQHPMQNVEVRNQAEDGKAYYAMATRPGLTWQIDGNDIAREQFLNHGALTNTATSNSNSGVIYLNSTVFAIAVDLGTITATQTPVAWAVGYVRDPVVQYTTITGASQQRRPYFVTTYSNIGDAIEAFIEDFPAAVDRAVTLDNMIIQDALKISSKYADLVSMSTRQTLDSLDITVFADPQGNVNGSDVKIFMKDIGTTGRISPVEKILAAFPAFLYLNASIGEGLLTPLLESQDTWYDQPYAAADLGGQYPVASGAPHSHNMRIEQTGNMLIMLYAYARVSGDGFLLTQHYELSKRWADYLVNNAITPVNSQATTDGEAIANMTNLALKGVVGIKAMAGISRAVGQDVDADYYDGHADTLISDWQSYARSTDYSHMLGIYNQSNSWALIYNWYADRLLGTNLLSDVIVDRQTSFYGDLLETATPFGLPIDNNPRQVLCSASWTMFTSASVSNNSVRDELIEGVWNRASSNGTYGASPDKYNCDTGAVISGLASPALGAMYAHLALTVPNVTITTHNGRNISGGNPEAETDKHSVAGPIVGGSLSILGVLILIAVAFLLRRRRNQLKQREKQSMMERLEVSQNKLSKPKPTLSPYYNTTTPMQSPWLCADSENSPTCVETIAAQSPGGAELDVEGVGSGATETSQQAVFSAGISGFGHGHGVFVPQAADHPSKARELERNTRQYNVAAMNPSIAGTVVPTSVTMPMDGTDSPSPQVQADADVRSAGDGSVVSDAVVAGLRSEVENLRRVMQEMRVQRFEPPPEYSG